MTDTGDKLVNHFLRKSSLFKESSSASHRVIQSRLTAQSLVLASKLNVNTDLLMNKNAFKLCQWCFCYWTEGMYSFRIEPQKRPSKSILSLLRRNIVNPSKVQLKLRKKYNERFNRIVLTCNVCNKKTKIPCEKPDKKIIDNSSDQHSLPNKLKKKKKKKDSFAGLKAEVVLKTKKSSSTNSSCFGPQDTKPSNNSKNIKSVGNIPGKSVKKKNRFNLEKLKNLLAKEKKNTTLSVTKSHNSLLSSFLQSL